MFLPSIIEGVRAGLFFGIFSSVVIERWQIHFLYKASLCVLTAFIYIFLTHLIIPLSSFSHINPFIYLPVFCLTSFLVEIALSFFPRKIKMF